MEICKKLRCYNEANHSGYCRNHQKMFIKKSKMYEEGLDKNKKNFKDKLIK